jgi:hypothetical protein
LAAWGALKRFVMKSEEWDLWRHCGKTCGTE